MTCGVEKEKKKRPRPRPRVLLTPALTCKQLRLKYKISLNFFFNRIMYRNFKTGQDFNSLGLFLTKRNHYFNVSINTNMIFCCLKGHR